MAITIKPIEGDENITEAYNKIRSIQIEAYDRVMAQREEILAAFVAKYGCQPDEIVQVLEGNVLDGFRWYVTLKKDM